MKDIVIYGSGGMGREIAWLIEEINNRTKLWNILGYIDDYPQNMGRIAYKYPVIGGMQWIKENPNTHCIIAIGNCNARKKIASQIENYCFFPTLIHPNTTLNESIKIGRGSIISSNVVLTTDIEIGEHVFVNVNSAIMHDVKIGNYTTIFLGANIAGGVRINDCVEIGSGATIIPYTSVGSDTVIGAGSVVHRDIFEKGTYVGVPARKIK